MNDITIPLDAPLLVIIEIPPFKGVFSGKQSTISGNQDKLTEHYRNSKSEMGRISLSFPALVFLLYPSPAGLTHVFHGNSVRVLSSWREFLPRFGVSFWGLVCWSKSWRHRWGGLLILSQVGVIITFDSALGRFRIGQ